MSQTSPTSSQPLRRLPINRDEAPSFDVISKCVHCGLCLEACPTYRELRVEMDSPRGRIYLMKGLLDGRIEPKPNVLRHLDQCLDCRACETACPSGVQYSEILERTRTVLQPLRKVGVVGRILRWFVFSLLLPSRGLQRLVFRVLRLGQVLGFSAVGRWLGERKLLPGRLSNAAATAPGVPALSFRDRNPQAFNEERGVFVFPARGKQRKRVALFTGCVADHLFADVNQATVDVLTRNGCQVEVVSAESCCGALHIHNGARDRARDLARANVRAFVPNDYDAIVSNAAGCSAELRHYGGLLAGEPGSTEFGSKVRDISELLVEIGWTPPVATPGGLTQKLAYDEPCHLLHAQKISAAPKAVLDALPGFQRVELTAADACCGSAGVYSLLQPDLAGDISARKIDHIKASGAEVIATGNPGCLLQIAAGARAAGLAIRVAHPVELLAEAYAREDRRQPDSLRGSP